MQAGEKLWGSVAEAVRAAAARREIQFRTHAEIWRFVLRLDREYPDKDFYVLFAVADHLHSNFYEDELPVEAVTAAVPKMKELVTRLRSV